MDDDPTQTNRRLREIIGALSGSCDSSWYIGYTATPFANLLTPEARDEADSQFGLSLCPRDFLHALEKPDSHLDNEDYFTVPDSPNVTIIHEPNRDSHEEAELFRELIIRHLATDLIRKQRGFGDDSHTTLIHTDVETADHARIFEIVNSQIEEIKEDYDIEDLTRQIFEISPEYLSTEEERQFTDYILELGEEIIDVVDEIEPIEVNRRRRGEEDDPRQDPRYSHGRKSYIAIGGHRLSRGLTLKGLTTTYFSALAGTPRYDTMMQMSRWCGFRLCRRRDIRYDDSVRIITTRHIGYIQGHCNSRG